MPPRSFVRWERCAFHEDQTIVPIARALPAGRTPPDEPAVRRPRPARRQLAARRATKCAQMCCSGPSIPVAGLPCGAWTFRRTATTGPP
jgi:hypothetical protein